MRSAILLQPDSLSWKLEVASEILSTVWCRSCLHEQSVGCNDNVTCDKAALFHMDRYFDSPVLNTSSLAREHVAESERAGRATAISSYMSPETLMKVVKESRSGVVRCNSACFGKLVSKRDTDLRILLASLPDGLRQPSQEQLRQCFLQRILNPNGYLLQALEKHAFPSNQVILGMHLRFGDFYQLRYHGNTTMKGSNAISRCGYSMTPSKMASYLFPCLAQRLSGFKGRIFVAADSVEAIELAKEFLGDKMLVPTVGAPLHTFRRFEKGLAHGVNEQAIDLHLKQMLDFVILSSPSQLVASCGTFSENAAALGGTKIAPLSRYCEFLSQSNPPAVSSSAAGTTRQCKLISENRTRDPVNGAVRKEYVEAVQTAALRGMWSHAAGVWQQSSSGASLKYTVRYARAARNGSAGIETITIQGQGRCPVAQLGDFPTLVFMRTASNGWEKDMFRVFNHAMQTRGLNGSRRLNVCFLEPEFPDAAACHRSRRCIEKFHEGVLIKVAFAQDVLLRMGHGQVMLFSDTDAVPVQRSAYRRLIDMFPVELDAKFMASSPGPNTGMYIVRRTEAAINFFEQWRRTMVEDMLHGPVGHDQFWTDVLLSRAHNAAPLRLGEPAGRLRWRQFSDVVTGVRAKLASCKVVVYHAIYTRDYTQKRNGWKTLFSKQSSADLTLTQLHNWKHGLCPAGVRLPTSAKAIFLGEGRAFMSGLKKQQTLAH